jgi:hypothetical protein
MRKRLILTAETRKKTRSARARPVNSGRLGKRFAREKLAEILEAWMDYPCVNKYTESY